LAVGWAWLTQASAIGPIARGVTFEVRNVRLKVAVLSKKSWTVTVSVWVLLVS
jgi:hypothetical protein